MLGKCLLHFAPAAIMVLCVSMYPIVLGADNNTATVEAVNGTVPDIIDPVFNASDTLNASALVFHNTSQLDLSTSTRRPPPPFFHVNMTVNSVYTFECVTAEFPMVWILGGSGYHFVDHPQQNMSRCRLTYVRGCPFSLIISHRCTGMMHNCTIRVEPPDEYEQCEADVFSITYQCVPAPTAEFPLQPYVVIPMVRKPDDPCDLYYQRKNGQLNATWDAVAE
ncbi:uncharacterized protein LOC129598910 [Paramacrobiotus metropolitanus]|uniref:uncharacterized protein LOC129598910 n=1 Tax=Paramacrobiotus metropolitanus TaxID=2943436 RepID=UPI002445FDE0|nr:uncharacterized protein LOC129598910 [Paramacrobiotus metropolitanus]